MRDQRCLCPKIILFFFSYGNLLTQISSTYKIIVDEMADPIMTSTYLLSECQC